MNRKIGQGSATSTNSTTRDRNLNFVSCRNDYDKNGIKDTSLVDEDDGDDGDAIMIMNEDLNHLYGYSDDTSGSGRRKDGKMSFCTFPTFWQFQLPLSLSNYNLNQNNQNNHLNHKDDFNQLKVLGSKMTMGCVIPPKFGGKWSCHFSASTDVDSRRRFGQASSILGLCYKILPQTNALLEWNSDYNHDHEHQHQHHHQHSKICCGASIHSIEIKSHIPTKDKDSSNIYYSISTPNIHIPSPLGGNHGLWFQSSLSILPSVHSHPPLSNDNWNTTSPYMDYLNHLNHFSLQFGSSTSPQPSLSPYSSHTTTTHFATTTTTTSSKQMHFHGSFNLGTNTNCATSTSTTTTTTTSKRTITPHAEIIITKPHLLSSPQHKGQFQISLSKYTLQSRAMITRAISSVTAFSMGIGYNHYYTHSHANNQNDNIFPDFFSKGLHWILGWERGDTYFEIPIFINSFNTNHAQFNNQRHIKILQSIATATYLSFISLLIDAILGAITNTIANDMLARILHIIQQPRTNDEENKLYLENQDQEFSTSTSPSKTYSNAKLMYKHKQQIENAMGQIRLMARKAKRNTNLEASKNGLVIIHALYWANGGYKMEATIQLQFWVSNSMLYLPKGQSKSNMIGFFNVNKYNTSAIIHQEEEKDDLSKNISNFHVVSKFIKNITHKIWTSVSKDKHNYDCNNDSHDGLKSTIPYLYVKYQFKGELFEITIRDDEKLELPSRSARKVVS